MSVKIGTLQLIAICFCIICGCFHVRAVELSIYSENQMACDCSLAVHKDGPLAPVLTTVGVFLFQVNL